VNNLCPDWKLLLWAALRDGLLLVSRGIRVSTVGLEEVPV